MHGLKNIIVVTLIILFFGSCDDKYKAFDSLNVTADSKRAFAVDTIIKDTVLNFSFSRVRGNGDRGLDATFKITPAHQDKDLYVVVSGRARTNYAYSNSTITFAAASSKGELLCWKAISLRYYYTDCNAWCSFKDSIFLKNSVDSKFYDKISAFAMLGNSEKENFDIDTLHVQLKEKL